MYMPESHRLIRFPWPTCEEMIFFTNKQPKEKMLPNKNKNKAKIILLILDWNLRRKLKHFTSH